MATQEIDREKIMDGAETAKRLFKVKQYVKIKSISQGSFFIDEIKNVNMTDLLDGCPTGDNDGYLVSIVELAREEFDALPGFTGF